MPPVRAWLPAPTARLRPDAVFAMPRSSYAPRQKVPDCSLRVSLAKGGVVVLGSPMTLAAGTRLGPYEILAPIGAGGMGEVYRARDERLKREVAVKVLPASFSMDPDRLRRFEQEAQAAGALNHPNITAVYDIGQHDGASIHRLGAARR